MPARSPAAQGDSAPQVGPVRQVDPAPQGDPVRQVDPGPRADHHAPGAALPKVIYVMGAGRSGSTILGITLGNCADVFFAGELARWYRRAGRPLTGARDPERERFWRAVRGELDVDVGVEGLGGEVGVLQRSSALFQIGSWPAQRRLRGRYRSACEDLFQAIARTAGKGCIVDTSHFPRRARAMQALGGIDLYLLFLVRDPQGVVASYRRRDVVQGPRFGVLATNAYLWLTYLLSTYVFLRHPSERRLLVRHEDFVANPEGVLREILDHIGSSADIPDLNALQPGPAFLANRLANAEVVALRSRLETRAHGSRVTALLHLPWRFVFSCLRPAAGRSAAAVGSVRAL